MRWWALVGAGARDGGRWWALVGALVGAGGRWRVATDWALVGRWWALIGRWWGADRTLVGR